MELTKENKQRLRHVIDDKIKKAKTNSIVKEELKQSWGVDCDDYEVDKFNQ